MYMGICVYVCIDCVYVDALRRQKRVSHTVKVTGRGEPPDVSSGN